MKPFHFDCDCIYLNLSLHLTCERLTFYLLSWSLGSQSVSSVHSVQLLQKVTSAIHWSFAFDRPSIFSSSFEILNQLKFLTDTLLPVVQGIVPGPRPIASTCPLKGCRAYELATGKALQLQADVMMEDKVSWLIDSSQSHRPQVTVCKATRTALTLTLCTWFCVSALVLESTVDTVNIDIKWW